MALDARQKERGAKVISPRKGASFTSVSEGFGGHEAALACSGKERFASGRSLKLRKGERSDQRIQSISAIRQRIFKPATFFAF